MPILGAILAVLAVIGIVTAILSGDSSSNIADTSVESAKGQANQIVQDMSKIKTAFEMQMVKNTLAPTLISFKGIKLDGTNTPVDSTNPEYQVFHPTSGSISPVPLPPASSMVGSATREYVVSKQNVLKGDTNSTDLGTAAADWVVAVADISQTTCQQLNKMIHNDTTIPTSGVAVTAFTGATGGNVVTAPAGTSARAMGCVGVTGSKYVAYQTLRAQ